MLTLNEALKAAGLPELFEAKEKYFWSDPKGGGTLVLS